MTLDSKLRAAAVKAVAKAPKSYVFVALGTQTYDPTTGLTTEASPTNHAVTASPPFDYDRRFVDGDVIRAGDCYVIVPAQGHTVTPVPGMKVTFDSKSFDVVAVRRYEGASSVIAWEVQLRR